MFFFFSSFQDFFMLSYLVSLKRNIPVFLVLDYCTINCDYYTINSDTPGSSSRPPTSEGEPCEQHRIRTGGQMYNSI